MIPALPERDHTRISVFDLLEVRYWCRQSGVSKARLREAIHQLGSSEVCRVKALLESGA